MGVQGSQGCYAETGNGKSALFISCIEPGYHIYWPCVVVIRTWKFNLSEPVQNWISQKFWENTVTMKSMLVQFWSVYFQLGCPDHFPQLLLVVCVPHCLQWLCRELCITYCKRWWRIQIKSTKNYGATNQTDSKNTLVASSRVLLIMRTTATNKTHSPLWFKVGCHEYYLPGPFYSVWPLFTEKI